MPRPGRPLLLDRQWPVPAAALWLMAQGLPQEFLDMATAKMATINAARAIRMSDQLGTIEAGKLADLVIVRGNPLQDIKNTRNVRQVMATCFESPGSWSTGKICVGSST